MSKKKRLTNDNEAELSAEIDDIIFRDIPSKIKVGSYWV